MHQCTHNANPDEHEECSLDEFPDQDRGTDRSGLCLSVHDGTPRLGYVTTDACSTIACRVN